MKNISLSSKQTITFVLTLLVICFLAGVAIPTQAQTPTVLYNFKNGASDGAFPAGNIVQGRDGFMYGVAAGSGRGANGTGVVYKISPAGVEKVFFNFPAKFVGCDSGLTLGTDGNFYGICTDNTSTNASSLYRLTPAAVFTDLHDFATTAYLPPIQASDGNLYGVIFTGVYKMTLAGVFTMIHTFASPDVQPISGIVQASDGNLYGTLTLCSNGNRGCVYKVSTAGVFAEVNLFADGTGSFPCTGVIQGSDGKFYGATDFGGANSSGALYSVTTAGAEVDLHDFNSTTDGGCNSGNGIVVNMLQVNDGNFYGTNNGGAIANNGTIYKLTAAHVFSAFPFPGNNVDGGQPYSTLIQNTNGKIYGTASGGGVNSTGVFFSVSTGDPAFVLLQETAGRVGSKIGILGQGFSASSVVKFNGVTATTVTRTGTTFLLATVPAGANDGFVTVTTGTKTLTSSKKFVVHDSWSSGTAIPTGVQWPMTGTIGSNIYVVGGYTSSAVVADNQIYNPVSNTWTTGPVIPVAIAQGASAVVNNILYVFGGSANGGGTVTNAVYAYSPATKKWTTRSAMPTARCSAVAVVEKGIVYVIGGFNGGRLNTVESYNPATNTWATESPLTVGKSEISAGLIGTTIVAAGGFASGGVTGDTEGYNATANTWSARTADSVFRNGACAGAIGGNLYSVNGNDNSNNAFSVNEAFNLAANKWTALKLAPQSMTDAGPAVYGGQLYCFGGAAFANAFHPTVYNNVQIYQP